MATTSAPLLLTDDGYVRWQTCTPRECGKDERFLEKVIGAHPQLLGLEDRRTNVHGPYVAFHQLRLDTPQGRTACPDIVFLTESGHIIVVEVKLSDNGELGDRRVVAQLLDYAASIAAYTESEIAVLFGGDDGQCFPDVVRTLFPDAAGPEELATVLLERMQSAELHLVIACDGVPSGLREFVQGVTNQSALGSYELRVVELSPHRTEGRPGVLLLPSTPIRTEIVARTAVNVTYLQGQPKPGVEVVVSSQDEVADAIRQAQAGAVREPRRTLAAVLEVYDSNAVPGLATTGRAPTYRAIKLSGWPGSVHYEFFTYGDNGIGVELHLESEAAKVVAPALQSAVARLRSNYPALTWDPKWSANRGRLVIRMDAASPTVVAETMRTFIADTRQLVDEALAAARQS